MRLIAEGIVASSLLCNERWFDSKGNPVTRELEEIRRKRVRSVATSSQTSSAIINLLGGWGSTPWLMVDGICEELMLIIRLLAIMSYTIAEMRSRDKCHLEKTTRLIYGMRLRLADRNDERVEAPTESPPPLSLSSNLAVSPLTFVPSSSSPSRADRSYTR